MSWAIILPLLLKAAPFIAIIAGFLGYGKYKERVGAQKVRAEQAKADQRSRDIADDVQSDIGSMSPEQIDAELRKRAQR